MGSEGIQVLQCGGGKTSRGMRIYLMQPRPDEINAISNRLSEVYAVLRRLVYLIEFWYACCSSGALQANECL